MSLRGTCEKRTVCEVLREINDTLQVNPIHKSILPKLIDAERMCKKMAGKLFEYNKEFDAGWWENNPNHQEDLKKRLNTNYIAG